LAVFTCQTGLVRVPAGNLALDGLFVAMIFGILSTLLWYITTFAGLSGNTNFQKIINYSAVVILCDLLWIGGDYLLLYLSLPDTVFLGIAKALPLKIILGMLLFTVVIRLYLDIQSDEEMQEEKETKALEKPDLHLSETDETYANPASMIKCPEKISVKVGQKIHMVAVTDIHFIQAEGDYVKIHTASNHFIKEQTMKYFEEILPSGKFVRIHRSAIVNTDVISRIELYEKQNYRITLQSGFQLKASASGYRLLKNTLQL
jgi:Response regulator of the LytR/AlgR family